MFYVHEVRNLLRASNFRTPARPAGFENFRLWSIGGSGGLLRHVRSTPGSRHQAEGSACPLGANPGLPLNEKTLPERTRTGKAPTATGRLGARVIAPIRVAFRHRNDVGARDEASAPVTRFTHRTGSLGELRNTAGSGRGPLAYCPEQSPLRGTLQCSLQIARSPVTDRSALA